MSIKICGRCLGGATYFCKLGCTLHRLTDGTRKGGKSESEREEEAAEASWILIGCLFFISPRRHNIYEFDLSELQPSNKTACQNVTRSESSPFTLSLSACLTLFFFFFFFYSRSGVTSLSLFLDLFLGASHAAKFSPNPTTRGDE